MTTYEWDIREGSFVINVTTDNPKTAAKLVCLLDLRRKKEMAYRSKDVNRIYIDDWSEDNEKTTNG